MYIKSATAGKRARINPPKLHPAVELLQIACFDQRQDSQTSCTTNTLLYESKAFIIDIDISNHAPTMDAVKEDSMMELLGHSSRAKNEYKRLYISECFRNIVTMKTNLTPFCHSHHLLVTSTSKYGRLSLGTGPSPKSASFCSRASTFYSAPLLFPTSSHILLKLSSYVETLPPSHSPGAHTRLL